MLGRAKLGSGGHNHNHAYCTLSSAKTIVRSSESDKVIIALGTHTHTCTHAHRTYLNRETKIIYDVAWQADLIFVCGCVSAAGTLGRTHTRTHAHNHKQTRTHIHIHIHLFCSSSMLLESRKRKFIASWISISSHTNATPRRMKTIIESFIIPLN